MAKNTNAEASAAALDANLTTDATHGNSANDLVRIKLRRDKRLGSDLYVNVNNHNFLIKRGEPVEVPRYIAEVIENSIRQDEETELMIEELSKNADF